MALKPLGSRVLVKVEKQEDVKKGGLIISADSLNLNYFKGAIVSVGQDVKQPIKAGDKIAFLKYGYEDMGDEMYLVEENSLLAMYE